MAKKRINYREGDWFAVPLRDGGYAVGVVARMDGRGGVLGYFFGPRRDTVPSLEEVHDLDPGQTLRIIRFGDLGLIENEWPIIGQSKAWERDHWPLPDFGRLEEVSGRALRVEYSEDNLAAAAGETQGPRDEVAKLPRDALSGAGAVELVLTHLLPR